MFRGVGRFFAAIFCGMALTLVNPGHLLSAPMPVQPTRNLASFPSQKGVPNPNDVFDAVNQARAERGLPLLQKDSALAQIAQDRATDMQKRAYYAHKNPDGLMYYDLLFQQHVGFDYSCENLDLQFTQSVSTYVDDWMNSNKGHRECMLNAETTRAGYAVVPLDTVSYSNNDVTAYIVVAIHAQN